MPKLDIIVLHLFGKILIIMLPFEEGKIYCFANVGRSVGMSIGRSVDQKVSADYLKYHSSQSLHISHVG